MLVILLFPLFQCNCLLQVPLQKNIQRYEHNEIKTEIKSLQYSFKLVYLCRCRLLAMDKWLLQIL